MSNVQRKRKYINFPRRQKSLGLSGDPDDPNQNTQRIPLHRIKSIDEKDSTEVERSNADLDKKSAKGKDKIYNLADRIKLAAIYDDEVEIHQILSSKASMKNGLWTWNFIIFINLPLH